MTNIIPFEQYENITEINVIHKVFSYNMTGNLR